MSNFKAITQDHRNPVALTDDEFMSVLRNSLFVGAKDESIKMAVSYCRAAGLDIMQKPVHLVPMNVKKPNGDYEWRDVVMPGIGLYRTQAARTGEYAGMSEPEFGEEITDKIGGVEITYPKWCLVTVKRIVGGIVVEFPAKEYWKENYATKKKDSLAPNSMWERRPFGQLAKCAEAQALRKAFPEFGAAPTADEMEGKIIDESTIIDGGTGEVIQQPQSKGSKSASVAPQDAQRVYEGELATEGMMKVVRGKLEHAALSDLDLHAKFGFKVEEMKASAVNDVLFWIQNPTGQ
jgi:phage recombination protein Bet